MLRNSALSMAARARSKVSSVTCPYTRNVTGSDLMLCPMNAVTPSDGVLHAGMTRQFEEMWRNPRRADGKG